MTIEAMETTEKTPNGKITKANDIVAIARAAYEAYVAKNRAAILLPKKVTPEMANASGTPRL